MAEDGDAGGFARVECGGVVIPRGIRPARGRVIVLRSGKFHRSIGREDDGAFANFALHAKPAERRARNCRLADRSESEGEFVPVALRQCPAGYDEGLADHHHVAHPPFILDEQARLVGRRLGQPQRRVHNLSVLRRRMSTPAPEVRLLRPVHFIPGEEHAAMMRMILRRERDDGFTCRSQQRIDTARAVRAECRTGRLGLQIAEQVPPRR